MVNTRAYNLEGFINIMESWGLTDVLLPFTLIFTIMFAILQKTRVFGEEKKNINMVVALVFGLLVVIPHVTNTYPAGMDIVEVLNSALPSVSIVVVAAIMLLVLIGIFGKEAVILGMALPGWITFISFFIIIFIFGNAAGWWGGQWGNWMEDFFGQDAIAIIIMLLVFGIIIAFITGESGERKERAGVGRMLDGLKDAFGGKK